MVQANQALPVSVIVPVFNAERYVFNSLSSVLGKQDADLEVIVVNDGSTDNSLNEVARIADSRVRVVDNLGKGIADALNTGLAAARGQIIVRCDADDLYPAHRITQQVKWLSQNPDFGAVCGGYAAIDPRGIQLVSFDESSQPEEITGELCAGFARTHLCTYAIRTEVLQALGGFRSYFATGEDIDLQLRLGEACRVWYQPGVYYYYRLHRTSITHTKSSSEREFFDGMAREFQLQRQTTGLDALQRGKPPVPPMSSNSRPLSAAQHIQKFLLWRAWYEHRAGQKWQAVTTGMRSVMTMPSNLSTWKSVLALAMKPVEAGDLLAKPTFRP